VPAELAGSFQVERPLGVGGSGKLFMAVHRESGERGLLKLLRSRLFRGNPDKQRIKRELSRQETLEHPHLLTPDRSGEVDNTLWCFREYVAGQTLRERLDSSGPIPGPEAMALCAQMATALHALHEAGLVHRDMKPEHVVLHDDGSGIPSGVLIDSGIAAPIAFDSVFDVNGTPAYVSPEQVQGRLISFRSDLYALGCVLYEMVTGRPMFEHDAVDALMLAHVQTEPPNVSELLPEGAAQLLRELVSKRPRERPASALEVFRRLSPLLTDAGRASVLSDPEGRPTRQRPSRPPPPPPPTAETLHLDDLAEGLGMPPAPTFGDATDYPTIQPGDVDVELNTEPPRGVEPAEAVPDNPDEAEGDPLEGEVETPQSIEPGPTTAEEAMHLDFDQLAESISGEVASDDFTAPAAPSENPPEPTPASSPQGSNDAGNEGADADNTPAENAPAADAPVENAPPVQAEGEEAQESAQATDDAAAADGKTEPVTGGTDRRLTIVLSAVIGAALLALWTIMTVELSGGNEEEMDSSPDAAVVYLYPEGGWYWQPDAAPEIDASLFADEPLDLLSPVMTLDIDAGLAPDAEPVVVPLPTGDASADASDAEAAADATADAEAGVDAASDSGSSDASLVPDASIPDASVPDAEMPSWDVRRQRARDLYVIRDYERALELYLSLVRERRDHAGSWAGLAACYTAQGDWPQSVSAMQQAISLNPQKSGYFASLGRSFLEINDPARARQAFEQSLSLNPRNVVAIRALRYLGVVIDPVQ